MCGSWGGGGGGRISGGEAIFGVVVGRAGVIISQGVVGMVGGFGEVGVGRGGFLGGGVVRGAGGVGGVACGGGG